jgi:predicted amino acid dehydrogenase
MKFATIGHIMDKKTLTHLPKDWGYNEIIFSPEKNINGIKGHITGLTLTPKEIMSLSREQVRKKILDAALFLQNKLEVDLIQLGALTTSVTSGGKWLTQQKEFKGYVNHGDSYTAAVTCRTVEKALEHFNKKPLDLTISIVGAYGVIGEAVSKILVPRFKESILIGRRQNKLEELKLSLNGNYKTTTTLETKDADVIVTATSHPTALLNSSHLKKNAIIVDVSQPPNLAKEICRKRPDICRIDGGYVDFPEIYNMIIPGVPPGKIFSCIVEVIMQSMENEKNHHVGSIDLKHLKKTEKWAEKYGFVVDELTNFGKTISER